MSIYTMRTKFGAGLRIILFIIALVFVFGAFYQFGGPGSQNNSGIPGNDDTIAIVNDVKIPRSAFNAKWETAMENAKRQGVISLLAFADVRTSAIVGLIQENQLITIAKSDEYGVKLDQNAINAQVDKLVVDSLKANRRMAMGSKANEKLDPRDDKEYSKTLADVGSSVKMQEDQIRSRIPEQQVMADMAQQGIIDSIKKKIDDKIINEVKDSYKVYSIRQIFLPKGKVSDEQLLLKAQGIVQKAREGTDFISLAVANSGLPDKAKGSPANYSLETNYMLPPEVGDAVKLLNAQQKISEAIKTDYGYFIVQLVSVKDTTPAKQDKKAEDARKKMVSQSLQMARISEVQKQMDTVEKIEITDNELKFLYDVYNATRKATSMEDATAKLKKSCEDFENAFNLNETVADKSPEAKQEVKQNLSDFARAKYAQVLAQTGQTKKAIAVLSQMVMGNGATAPSADMSKMLGDLFVQNKEIDKAVKCYQDASDMARFDINLRKSLVASYKQIGRNDLAAAETTLIAKKESDIKIWEKKNKGAAPALPGQNPSPAPGQMP